MNLQIIKEKYSKSYNKLTTWSLNMLAEYGALDKATRDSITPETMDNLLTSMVAYNQRAFYDFFDNFQIHMFPMGSIEWVFRIVDPETNHDNSENEEKYAHRKLAEDAGFNMCFAILGKKLS